MSTAKSPTCCGIAWATMASAVVVPSAKVGDKRRGDDDAVTEVVHRIADEDHHSRPAVVEAVGVAVRTRSRGIGERFDLEVAVPPQDQLLEQKEQQQAGEHGDHHVLGRAELECVRQKLEKNRAEEGADGEAHQARDPSRMQR